MILVDHVVKSYKQHFWSQKELVLDDISFEIKEGELALLVGKNGSGKSTLIKIIIGTLNADSGCVRIQNYAPRSQNRPDIGYLSEVDHLPANISVKEWIELHANLAKRQSTKAQIQTSLKKLDLLSFQNKKLSELSKGMKRRTAFAAATVSQPKILILDEPLSGLDRFSRDLISDFLIELQKQKITILIVSHNDEEWRADKIFVLKNKKITEPVTIKSNLVARKIILKQNLAKDQWLSCPISESNLVSAMYHPHSQQITSFLSKNDQQTTNLLKWLMANNLSVNQIRPDFGHLLN